MRASAKARTGNVGETEVTAKFERLNWGVTPNPRHDLGTDLWLSARDDRLFDLGLMAGAQVKGGSSWFKEPYVEDGTFMGWWFRDKNRKHMDAWLAHAVPHLVVLHDLDKDASYWVHVTHEAVISTGKGAKILVPVSHTVDEAHRDALLRVAASKRTGGAWEGSAWTGAAAVPPSALLRHALIVPRLVAPHPNMGRDQEVTSTQAVALLVQLRLSDLRLKSQAHDSFPSLRDALTSRDWDWRFLGALGRRVLAGERRPLLDSTLDAPDPARRTASGVVAAASLLEDSLAEEAIQVLDAALEDDETEPVDQAWLVIQKARACVELGRLGQARDLAARAQSVGATLAEDVTATALAGVASSLLFNTSDWAGSDLAAVISGADTTAAWWRTQTVSWGLTAQSKRTFWAWSRDQTSRSSDGDPASNPLLSATLTASYAGDHGTWQHLSALFAMDQLIRLDRYCDPADAATGLRTLLKAGALDNMKHALRRLVDDGPSQAITMVAHEVDLNHITRTTAPTALILLERGGEFLDVKSADEAVGWLLATINAPAVFVDRTCPNYQLEDRLIETLAGIVGAASQASQRNVASQIAKLPPQTDQLLATSWARLVKELPDAAWTPETARTAAVSVGHHPTLEIALLSAALPYVQSVRERLLADAVAGDLEVLGALGNVRLLPPDVIAALIEVLAGKVRQQIAEAEAHSWYPIRYDVGAWLALINIWHPGLAVWQPLTDLIANPLVVNAYKRGVLQQLAGASARLSDAVRADISKSVRVAAGLPIKPFVGLLRENDDIGGLLRELGASLTHGEDPDSIPGMLDGDAVARSAAVRVVQRLERPEHLGILLVLAADDDPGVRSNACFALTERAVSHGDPMAVAAVRRAAQDPGRRVAEAVAVALAAGQGLQQEMSEVLDLLATHHSARVRQAARRSQRP